MVNKIKIPLRIINTEKQLLGVKKWKIAEVDKKSVALFVKDLQLGKITGNQMCAGTLWVYVTNLKIALEFINKPVANVTPKDTERLSEVLLKDELRYSIKIKDKEGKITRESKTYTETSKIKIKTSAINFLEWKLKDKADKLTKILKIKPRLRMPTPDYLSEVQVEKLFKACSTTTEKFFIAVLFDSGARAEEFHNIRREDIELPKGEANFVKLSLKEEYSKTKGRTIGLYWKYSLSAVKDYIDERTREGIQPEEPVFKMKYKTMRKWLNDFGRQILGRKVFYHLFRHSSSSYYADKLNRQQLCVRYGWAFRSPMVDRYINRTSLGEKEIEEKFEKTEIEDLKVQLEEFKHKSKLKDVEVEDLREAVRMLALDLKTKIGEANSKLEASEKTKSVPAS